VIRQADRSDIPAVMEIEASLYSEPWDTQLFMDAISAKDKSVFAAVETGVLAGYVVFERVLDEGHVTNIAVSKPYQRWGIASSLISYVIELAKSEKLKEIFLEVRETNEAARKLYSKFGFSEIGRRKAYYHKTNEDALLYKLDI